MSYEFRVPISAAWGQEFPPDGNVTGFCVHAYGQAAGKHVWWPDNEGTGPIPAIEYCDNASYYGDLVFHTSDNYPDHLEYVSGDDQTGTVGTNITQPFQIRALNQTGGVVPNVPINFTITDVPFTATGHYFVESGQPWCIAYTDALGVANATLHLGSRPGEYLVNASNSGLAGTPNYINTLNATATIGLLDNIDVIAVPDAVNPGGGSTLTIWANDSQGNGISGLVIDVDFDAKLSDPGASVSTPATHVVNGTYTATYTAGSTGGVVDIVNASSSGIFGTASITVNASVQTLANLDVAASPDTVEQGTGSSTITIWANDTVGGAMPGLTINMDFDANPSGGAATISSPAADNGDGTYTATYNTGATGGVVDIVNASFGVVYGTVNIAVTQVLATLDIAASPTAVQVTGNSTITVWANDTDGAGIPGLTIDLNFDASPSDPGTSVNATAYDNGGGRYTANYSAGQTAGVTDIVNATTGGLNATVGIDVLPGPAYDLVYVTGNGQTQNVDTMLAARFLVRAVDQFGNNVSGVQVNWTLDGFPAGASGQTILPVTNNTNASGIAGAGMTLGDLAGYYFANATSPSIPGDSVAFSAEALGIPAPTYPDMVVNLATNVTSVAAGSSFTFILNYANIGTEAAANVSVDMSFSSSETYLSDSSGITPSVNNSNYSWFFASVPVGSHSFSVVCGVPSYDSATSITNHFTVDYEDQRGQAMTRETSNTVTLSILSEVVVNVRPTIEGVPDLIVHYDWDYAIDLSPYIVDPDSADSELYLLFSDNVHARVDTTYHLTMVLNYSQDLVDTTLNLTIIVSDGLGSDSDTITVTVTDDFPPEMISHLPDVGMSEDTVVEAFNITEYFFDRDGDAVYYTSGEVHIHVEILSNGMVMLTPETNWFGYERITFRATSGTLGALVEDSIIVTVHPVNDAPVLTAIPDQEGTVNIAWVLDIGLYVSDVDNDLDDLTVTTDSGYVTVNGLNLTFRATDEVESDIITVTVSDGEDETYAQVNVVVLPATAGSSIPIWIFPPIVILIAVALLFLLLAKRKKPVIEQAYLIFHDGTLICHVTNRMIPEMDSEIFSSMFMAIQDFVKDSFKDEKKWELKKLEFGDNRIFVERGQSGWTILALVYQDGTDSQLQSLACNTLNAIEKEYFDILETWDGNLDKIRGTKDIVKRVLAMK